ncbi:MAG: hypothetical protein KC713_09230 [Candidatus Omnitrophica bacterium]|nr:hypothetical protein [Candidatus Omnitrophota bacterium]
MIVKLAGKLVEKTELTIVLEVRDVYYEIYVPQPVMQRLDDATNDEGVTDIIIYHYFQLGHGTGMPYLIGFLNTVERDFFLQFIKVSGIGPRAAVKAINKPISEIVSAIDKGDVAFLKGLPGIGSQKAKEIVAKLQGRIGKYGLIKDHSDVKMPLNTAANLQQEALSVLMQLQYHKSEAEKMISSALDRDQSIQNIEELLNEIYKQRVNQS